MKKTWINWDGKRAMDPEGEIFIETKISQWHERLKIKRDNLSDVSCPWPMPCGHIMFSGKYDYYRLVNNR